MEYVNLVHEPIVQRYGQAGAQTNSCAQVDFKTEVRIPIVMFWYLEAGG